MPIAKKRKIFVEKNIAGVFIGVAKFFTKVIDLFLFLH
jgi:hypothetical protein